MSASPDLPTVDLVCRGLLFDCDGVLVGSLGTAELAWEQWSTEHGLDPAVVLPGIHGRRAQDTIEALLPARDRARALARIEQIEIESAGATEPVPGVPELLAALPEVWAVVTSATRPLLEARLRAAGLPRPAVAVTAEDVRAGKPDPQGYLLAAERLGLAARDCVVLEDSAAGVLAGLAAGAGHVLGVGREALGTDAGPVVLDLKPASWTGSALRLAGPHVLRTGAQDSPR